MCFQVETVSDVVSVDDEVYERRKRKKSEIQYERDRETGEK